MTKLATLKSQIGSLRRQRARARGTTAWSAVVLAVLWAFLAIFALDWAFTLTVLQRVIVFVVAAGIIAWVFRRKTLPWLHSNETDLDVALLVEKQQKIDSDLVAAIQFESPEAAGWGSTQLESAVVDYVAEFSQGWNVYDGFTRKNLAKRAAAIVGTLAVILLLAVVIPGHFDTYLNRLLLGGRHYPTATRIVEAKINKVSLPVEYGIPWTEGRFGYGESLKFRVTCDGELPEEGTIKLVASNNMPTEIKLTRVTEDSLEGQPIKAGTAVYEGALPRLVDSLDCALYFGDAYTDPRNIKVLPLPIIEATLVGIPPEYARGGKGGDVKRETAKQLKTLADSRVEVEVVCKNDKKLQRVALVVERPTEFPEDAKYERDKDGLPIFPLTAAEGDVDESNRQIWRLSGENTPLQRIHGEGIAYKLVVIDEDRMPPERPISGSIVALPDMPPTARLAYKRNYCTPNAVPSIGVHMEDGFGIEKAAFVVTVTRAGTENVEKYEVAYHAGSKLPASELPMTGTKQFDLSPFSLTKDDKVMIELQVTDYRGPQDGLVGTSNPLNLIVADEARVLAELAKPTKVLVDEIDVIKDTLKTEYRSQN